LAQWGGAARTALVLLLWAAGLGAAAQFAKFGLILPELTAVYPGHAAGMGLLVSLISLMGVVLGLVAGLVAGGIGPRPLLLGALVLGAAVSLAQAPLPPFEVMLALRVVEGLSHLGVVVAAPTLIAGVSGARHRSLAMSLWATFFGVAFAVVAWVGLPLVAARGPGALFAAHGAFMAAVALALMAALPRVAAGSGGGPAPTAGAVARRHAAAYASPAVAAPALGWTFYTLTFVALLAVLPGTVPPQDRALVAGAMPLASIVVAMTLGVALLRWTSGVGVTCLGFAVSIGAGALVLAWPGEPWPCVALLGALGLVQGASFAAIPQLVPDPVEQALANGAMAQTGNLGNLLGTPVFLVVLGHAGFGAVMALAIACWVAGLATHAALARRRARIAAPARSVVNP
jgi:predicted MFS family arabinose efflux permease